MDELNKKIAGLRNMMQDMKSEVYAIVNPELVALDEYTKNLYIKVLCTVIQYENNPSEMQVLYLKRILGGIGIEDSLEEYMRKALEISDVDIREIIEFMKENLIRYYFALDGIVLVSLGISSKNNYQYFAELIELCGITKRDLEYLTLVAKSILQQDSAYYDEAKKIMPESVMKVNFLPYITNYYAGVVMDTDYEQYYFAPDGEYVHNIEFPAKYTARNITFENLVITIDKTWYFMGCENVRFINCRINGEHINFRAIGKLIFEQCEFTNMHNRIACFDNVNEIILQNCLLNNCGCKKRESGSLVGGTFHFINTTNTRIFSFNKNIVQECYIESFNSYWSARGVLFFAALNVQYKINENQFIGCWCSSNGDYAKAIIGNAKESASNFECKGNIVTGELTRMFELI